MAEISLHDYLQQIETLLEENRLSEAIAHCRHILQKFPWHVDTYRLYGKALLEQQKYDDAVDIFRRVLSADPEDFISHVGLAITHKEKEEVPEAIWHMERAFEMDPYNGAIQDELRGLYANRDGLRPERINLTRGALARLYFRGNLYQQAAAELRQLLAQDGERVDLQTLLAETLWRDDQRVDVVDICLRILDTLPNCVKANAILAEVWLVSGRTDEAQEYLQRLRMLTRPEKAHLEPDSVVARAFRASNGSADIPDQTLIEELDYFPVAQTLSGDADWVKEFGVDPEADEEANWLDEMGDVEADIFAEAAESDEDMLDWLREVAVSEEDSLDETDRSLETDFLGDFEDDGPPLVGDERHAEAFGWLNEKDDSDSESSEDEPGLPDWLTEVTASAEADMWNTAIEAEENSKVEDGAAEVDDSIGEAETPDWIRDVAEESADLDDSLSDLGEDIGGFYDDDDETIPDWMRSGAVDSDPFPDWLSNTGELSSAGGNELPDWLSQPEEQPTSEESFPDLSLEGAVYDVTGEDLPDWLLGSAESPEIEEEMPIDARLDADFEEAFDSLESEFASETDDALPDWLTDMEGMAEVEDTAADDALPDWLSVEDDEQEPELPVETSLEADFAEALEALEAEPTFETDDTDEDMLPDWLTDMEGMAEVEDTADDDDALPDWLAVEDDEQETASSLETAGEDSLDWLADFDEAETEQSDEGLPAWLEESPDLIVGQTDIDYDALPDWLEGDDQEEMVREEMLMGNSEDSENNEPDIPEDLDEAMKWLEELAAEQGADLAELPSLQTEPAATEEAAPAEAGAVEADDVPDWLKADLSEGELSTEDDLPDWLKNEAASMADADWLNMSDDEELTELDLATFGAEELEPEGLAEPSEIPDWLKAQMPEDLQGEVGESAEDSDLGWLDQIAAGEGAAIEEPPTLSWDDGQGDGSQDEFDLEAEGGDLSWLDEMPGLDDVPEQEAAELAEMPDDLFEDVSTTQVPDDPDDAMAWLEQLAAQQGAPLDELPTVFETPETAVEDELDSSEMPTVVDMPKAVEAETPEFEIPEDPDEAMAWLEALAAQQGASLDELPTVDVVPDMPTPVTGIMAEDDEAPTELSAEMDVSDLPTMIELPEEDDSESAEFDIPDDPDDAMAWLEQLAARQGASLDELPTVDVVEEMSTPVTGIEIVEAEFETAVELDPEVDAEFELAMAELSDIDMPEDDDEALAWLEAFAGGEAVAAADEDVETAFYVEPDLMTEETVIESAPAQETDIFDPADSYPTEIEQVEAEPEPYQEEPEEVSLFDAIEDETDQFLDLSDVSSEDIDAELEDENLAEALPDWLQFAPMGETEQEGLDWLNTFDEPDVDSWLEAEEQVSHADLPTPISAEDPEPLSFEGSEAVDEPETVEDTLEDEELDLEELRRFQTGPLNPSQVEGARTALEIGDYETAMTEYKSLLESGQSLSLLIAELETESAKHSHIGGLQRLLGDAYMQNGQLQKAIDTYRQALDNL